MGLLPLNHFDDPPQLSLQVVLLAFNSIMCLRLSRTGGLRRHAHKQERAEWKAGSYQGKITALTKLSS